MKTMLPNIPSDVPQREPAPALGPWDRKRARMSLEIERAGLRLLGRHGIDNVTVEQVAAEARISTRTFFRYFRNVPDLLTGVPRREVEQFCEQVVARPAGEGILAAFRAVFEQLDAGGVPETDDSPLKEENLLLWSTVVRQEPENASTKSQAMTVMARGYTTAIATRLCVPSTDETAGALAAALAGLVWHAYLRWTESGGHDSLPARLDDAFEKLGELFRASETPPASARRRSRQVS